MNIIDKVKKLFLTIAITFGACTTKTYGQQLMYGPPEMMTKEITSSQPTGIISILSEKIVLIVAIPIIIVIGIIVFIKKSKNKN